MQEIWLFWSIKTLLYFCLRTQPPFIKGALLGETNSDLKKPHLVNTPRKTKNLSQVFLEFDWSYKVRATTDILENNFVLSFGLILDVFLQIYVPVDYLLLLIFTIFIPPHIQYKLTSINVVAPMIQSFWIGEINPLFMNSIQKIVFFWNRR